MGKISYIKVENYNCSLAKKIESLIPVIKRNDFIVESNFTVGGDAPKDFIKVYKYGESKRGNPKKWIKFIAKTGHKHYPNESISEHLLNCIGQELGLNMSQSELAVISGQLRFLSRYFLNNKKNELVHGIDIFANYISDRPFVEEVENQNLARDFFTFQFTCDAIKHTFTNSEEIVEGFVKMLVFDAIVGNNDRHFFNWGVVKYIDGGRKPYFSPIYDTARGLFWNVYEQKVVDIVKGRNGRLIQSYLETYINRSFPKTGWETEKSLNHIALINRLKGSSLRYSTIINGLLQSKNEIQVLSMLDSRFSNLLSVERLFLIKECLKMRFDILRK